MLLLSVSHRFSKSADAIGLGDVRFHDLRHAYATRLLERGVHPKVVSEALGHASISITLDTYSHVMPSMSQVAADAIDARADVTNRESDGLLDLQAWPE